MEVRDQNEQLRSPMILLCVKHYVFLHSLYQISNIVKYVLFTESKVQVKENQYIMKCKMSGSLCTVISKSMLMSTKIKQDLNLTAS